MKINKTLLRPILSSILAANLLAGCLTTSLQTSTSMSQSIFLLPPSKEEKIVFLNIKNTSGHDVNLEAKLKNALEAKGYKIVTDVKQANYILSTNILYCDKKQENNALGGALTVGTAGVMIGAYNTDSASKVAAAGAAGALVGGLIAKLMEDTIWQMQVDINIRQKAQGKVLSSSTDISEQASLSAKRQSGFLNSFAGDVRGDGVGKLNSNQIKSTKQSYKDEYIEKSTIIFAEAVKRGLKLSEATPILEDKISNQIANLF